MDLVFLVPQYLKLKVDFSGLDKFGRFEHKDKNTSSKYLHVCILCAIFYKTRNIDVVLKKVDAMQFVPLKYLICAVM